MLFRSEDDDEDTFELPKVIHRRLSRPPISLPSERENGSDADDESDLSDVPEQEGGHDSRRRGEEPEEQDAEAPQEQKQWRNKSVRRQSEAILAREEVRRRTEEVPDTDESINESGKEDGDGQDDLGAAESGGEEQEKGRVMLGEEEDQDLGSEGL